MHKPNSNKLISTVSENICAVLILPNPPKNYSTYEWYWRGICGVPFLLRNVFNLQRTGLNSLLIYRDEDNIDLYKKLCEEKKISIKLNWITDIKEIAQLTKDCSVLILNGGALHTKMEIESGINFNKDRNETLTQFLERENMSKTINQITLGNKLYWVQPYRNRDSDINFLPGKRDSCITESQDFLIQQKNLLQSSGLSNDSFMDRTITRFFSRQFTRLFLKTPLSPNMITILSLVIGLISSVFFLHGTYNSSIIGAGLLLLSAWIDCTDGEVARLKFLESKTGGKLDIICDNLVHIAVFFAIGMGLYHSTGQSIFKLFGFLAVLGNVLSFLLLRSSIIDEKEKVSTNASDLNVKQTLTNNLANRDFIYILFLMAIIGRVDIFICITAFGSNIFATYLTYSKIKSALSAS